MLTKSLVDVGGTGEEQRRASPRARSDPAARGLVKRCRYHVCSASPSLTVVFLFALAGHASRSRNSQGDCLTH